ncbi:MAG: hypothetical protein ACI3XQ_04770 [Eubacteriales bacterium]
MKKNYYSPAAFIVKIGTADVIAASVLSVSDYLGYEDIERCDYITN